MDKGKICQQTDLIRTNMRRNERKSHREENVHDKKCRDRARDRGKENKGGHESWSLRRHILRLRVRKENTGNATRV